jgi:NAD(P)-dependent dehydrogenase (short-subunit alcohol dehydrogenase family)
MLLTLSAIVHVLDLSKELDIHSEEHTGKLYFYPETDISSRERVSEVFKLITERSSTVDGVVNNAGISPLSPTPIEPDEYYNKIMSVNVGGVWNVGSAYLQYVLDDYPHIGAAGKGGGSMVNIGSSASVQGFSRIAVYCASKHAVLGLTRSWAKDFAGKGVRVNCVAPGVTDTPLLRNGRKDLPLIDEYTKAVPLGRLGTPDEIGEMVLFLLGDASSYVTGQILHVNGGLH